MAQAGASQAKWAGFMLEREKGVMETVVMIVQGCIWPVKMGWLAGLSP
jgi:hypothetical protein